MGALTSAGASTGSIACMSRVLCVRCKSSLGNVLRLIVFLFILMRARLSDTRDSREGPSATCVVKGVPYAPYGTVIRIAYGMLYSMLRLYFMIFFLCMLPYVSLRPFC